MHYDSLFLAVNGCYLLLLIYFRGSILLSYSRLKGAQGGRLCNYVSAVPLMAGLALVQGLAMVRRYDCLLK